LGALAGSWATHLQPNVLIIIPLSLCAALVIRAAASTVAPKVTWLPAAAEGGLQICSIGLSLACLSYVGAKTGFPLRDTQIASIDAYLGFHWPTFAHWIDHRAYLLGFLNASYATFTAQLILTAVALFVFQRYDELDRFFLTFICASLLAEALSSLAPTLGPAASLAPGVSFAHVRMIGRTTAEILLALRNGTLTTIDLRSLDGIISFPSLHAAVAILVPFFLRWNRALFWPAVALNSLMLISAVPSGNHYLSDVVAGVGVAAVSIALLNHGWLAMCWPVSGLRASGEMAKLAQALQPEARCSASNSP
jgi:membrane-associated phospholipid phosphatase